MPHHHRRSLIELTYKFFNSAMWSDTIKDFILAHCYFFTGEEEFSLEHFKCHKDFCKVIEDTLNIYLLEIVGVSFEDFEKAVLLASQNPNSIAQKVLTILKQATDFKYFAAKMYAYNVMLDRECAETFVVEGKNAFFNPNANPKEELQKVDFLVQDAAVKVNDVEKSLGLPPTDISSEIQSINQHIEPPSEPKPTPESLIEQNPTLPEKKAQPGLLPPLEESKTTKTEPQTNSTLQLASMTPQERERMKKKILKEKEAENKAIDPAEIEKRKAIFQKRKEELIQQKRTVIQEEIALDLQKHEKPVVEPDEDPIEAIRKALSQRVKTVINET